MHSMASLVWSRQTVKNVQNGSLNGAACRLSRLKNGGMQTMALDYGFRPSTCDGQERQREWEREREREDNLSINKYFMHLRIIDVCMYMSVCVYI